MHVPVLPDEVLALLEPQRGGTFVDCTVGLGGHSRLMLERGARCGARRACGERSCGGSRTPCCRWHLNARDEHSIPSRR
ncbi:MAG: 16S rRNA (cytosine(1402)-N(4))-methyltransferase [Gammaproteobacteria bacterium]|nr:16S rRNA (cytosine(1402)-N(4))-methyltransferase [Gammaproteobacteria bacterium]